MDTRGQRGLDGRGAEPPPCRQGPLGNFRLRRLAHHVDQTLRERPGAVAEHPGGCGARPRRAVLDSTPLCGAGRVEDPVHLLGQALRQAVGRAAQALGTSAEAVVEDAGLTLVGHRSLTAALDGDWGEASARSRALGLVLEEGAQWPRWLEQPQTLAAQHPPLQEGRETRTQTAHAGHRARPGGWTGRATDPAARRA